MTNNDLQFDAVMELKRTTLLPTERFETIFLSFFADYKRFTEGQHKRPRGIEFTLGFVSHFSTVHDVCFVP